MVLKATPPRASRSRMSFTSPATSPRVVRAAEAEKATGSATVAQGPCALPGSVWRILATEFGERFSYYGLRAVLTLYFLSIGYTEAESVSLFAYTSALAYFTPLLGGFVADAFWGRYRTILVFSLIYVLGSAMLAVSAASGGGPKGALAALVLISVGTGGIKPCVSAFGADQLTEGGEAARARYFASFYFAINVGSTLSFVVTPILRLQFGFPAAFAASALVLSMAVAVFISGQTGYRQEPPAGSFYSDIAKKLWFWLKGVLGDKSYRQLGPDRATPSSIGAASRGSGREEEFEEFPGPQRPVSPGGSSMSEVFCAVRGLLPVLLLMPCFWALFDQQGSAWVLQAKAMRRTGILPFEITPEMLQIFNPIFVVMLVPITTRLFESWPKLFKGRSTPHPLVKMHCGMLLAALAFLCSAGVQHWVDVAPKSSVPVLWQLPQFFLITLSEVLVSVVSLDYFYAAAPVEAKTAVAALALLAVSIGDLLCGFLYQVMAPHLLARDMLLAFAGLMLLNSAALWGVMRSRGVWK